MAAAATGRRDDWWMGFQTRGEVFLAGRRGACNMTRCYQDPESIDEMYACQGHGVGGINDHPGTPFVQQPIIAALVCLTKSRRFWSEGSAKTFTPCSS